MIRRRSFRGLWISIVLPLLLLVFPARIGTAAERAKTRAVDEAKQRAAATYVKLPLSFEINQGQTDPRVKFLSRGGGYTLFLTGNEAVLSLQKKAGEAPPFRAARTGLKPGATTSVDKPTPDNGALTAYAVLRTRLVGANLKAAVTGAEELPGKSNYFIGNDPQKWRTNVPNYAKVRYQGVYPGVDLVYYGNQGGQLEYDFVVAPGANPRAIRFALETGNSKLETGNSKPGAFQSAFGNWQSTIRLDANGDLAVHLDGGEVHFQKPVAYQPMTGDPEAQIQNRKLLDGRYVLLAGNRVGFEIPNYDKTKPVVIDPVLIYSTYLGGSGTDFGNGVAVDSSGNAYVTGQTSSPDFPATKPAGVCVGTCGTGANYNAFVAKLNAAGSALVYSTYLGGSGQDHGNGIAVDSSGSAYVTGWTTSADFPTVNPWQATNKSVSGTAFVAELDSTGSALVYSTYLGGNILDSANGIAVDSSGNAYVTGWTQSTTFPTANPVQASFGGGNGDAFVAKLNFNASSAPPLALVYSTYLGGSGTDEANGIAVDGAGNAYVTGWTQSTNFPTANPVQASFGGGNGDAFVAELSFNATTSVLTLVYSTYLGGSGVDQARGIAVDSSGNAYVTGTTCSSNFPTVTPLQPNFAGGCSNGSSAGDAFVAKLNAGGSALVYSTYLGGSGDDLGSAIGVDAAGNAYVTGWTSSTDFPSANPFQPTFGGGSSNAFVAQLNAAGSALVYSTYLGGGGMDQAYGIAVDSSGNTYVTGSTSSTNFPASENFTSTGTAQPCSPTTETPCLTGTNNTFVARITALTPGVSLSPTALTFADQVMGTPSPEQAVTVTSSGTFALTIASIVASGDYAQTNTCPISPATLSPGSTCTISVIFTPTAVGTRAGTLTISDNSNGVVTGSTQTVALSGTGVLPPGAMVGYLAFLVQPSNTTAGRVISPAVKITAQDSTGAAVPGANISLSIGTNPGGGTLSGTIPQMTNASGIATFSDLSIDRAGQGYTLLASVVGYPTVTATSSVFNIVSPIPVPQIEQPLVPASAIPGGSGFTLTVNGTGFVSSSVVNWNASPLATNFVNDEQLTATVPAANIATAGTALVTVVNPAPGGGRSNVAFFEITSPTSSVSLANAPGSPIAVPSPPGGLGSNPMSIAVGDFNNDGKLDLAIANNCASCSPVYPSTLTILLGNGDGTFRTAPGSPITVPFGPEFVGAGDFNGDGKLDLVVANMFGNGLTILLGNGDGSFTPAAGSPITTVGGNPMSIGIGDFNGDGILDLAVTDGTVETHNLTILLGKGDGTFTPVSPSPATGSAPAGIAVGDFNGDGKLDLAVTNAFDNTVTILLGNGDGTFTPTASSPLAVGTEPLAVAVGDFNGDGKLDLAVANVGSNNVTIFLGNGNGTFTPASGSPVAVGSGPNAVAVGDFNGDGKLDLAVSNSASNNVTILLGNGDGTFTPASSSPVAVGAGPTAVAVGDFNRDGRLDLGTANDAGNTVSVLLQAPLAGLSTNSLTFSSQVVGTTSSPQSVTLTNTGTAGMAISSVSLSGANAANFALPGNTCPMLTPPTSCAPSTWFFNAFPLASPPFSSVFYVTAPNGNGDRLVVGTPTGGTSALLTAIGNVPFPNATNQQFCDFVQLVPGAQALAYVPSAAERTGDFSAFAGLLIDPTTGTPVSDGVLSPQTSTFWAWRVPANAFSPPAGLALGATCTINVSFSPLTAGASSAQATIGDNAAGAFQVVSLTGTGVTPVVALSPASLSLTFGNQSLGTTSGPQPVTLSNTGNGTLTITSIVTSANFAETDNCAGSVAASSSCTINVTFTPTATGTLTGNLTITDNNNGVAGSTQSVTLTGTGNPYASTPYAPIAIELQPGGGTNLYAFTGIVSPFHPNAFNYKVTYPALLNPPTTPVYLVVQPILITQDDLSALVTGTSFQNAQLVVYDETGGFGVLFRATCQDSSGNSVTCPTTTGASTFYTSWDTPSGAPSISCPAFLMAPVGTNAWQNIFTGFSQTRIDPTGVGHTGPGYSDFVFVQNICGIPPAYTPIAEPLIPTGGTNAYQFAQNLFNYKVTYPALASPPPTTVNLVVQPFLVSQDDLNGLVAGTGFAGAQLVPYDGTAGHGVLFQATCQDSSGNTVTCPTTTGASTFYTSWDTPSGAPPINCPAFLMAPVGTNAWQNIFTTLSQTRIDPTGVGHTGPGYSDFVFVQQICGTPPTIAITAPQDGAQYVVNQIVYANYSCTGSSVTACVGPVPSGSAIDTSSVGSKTFEVTAVVSSGPSADQQVSYTVLQTSTTAVSTTPGSSVAGQAYTVSVTVSPQVSGTPTGTVAVSDPTGPTCSISLSGGAGSCLLTPTLAGARTITATYSGDTNFMRSSGTTTQTVGPGPVVKLLVSPPNATITAGGSQTYSAEGFDAYNNYGDVTSSTTFGIAPNGSCTGASCTATVADVNGSSHTVTGTYGTNGPIGQATLTVNAASFTQLQLLVPGGSAPNTQYVNGPFNVTVNAVDQYWNLVNTVTDTVAITSTDPLAVLPSNAPLGTGTGTATFKVTLETVSYPASTTLKASDVTNSAMTASTSPPIPVVVVYTASITPADAATGVSTSYMLTVSNNSTVNGNTNSLRSVTVAIPTYGGTLSGISVAAANGSTSVNWMVDSSPPAAYASGYVTVRECTATDTAAPCNGSGGNDVAPGGTITIQFTDTSSASVSNAVVPEVWTTTAYSDAAYTNALPLAPPEPTVNIGAAPQITSANSANAFTYGTAGTTFSVTTSGYPLPSLSVSGKFPSWATFTDNHNGTATISGTPTAAGPSTFTITAHNGYGSDATQSFTLTVNRAASTTTFTSTAPSQLPYNGTYTPTATTTGDGTLTIGASGACAISSGVVTITAGSGTCTVTATTAQGNDYLGSSATPPQTITAVKAGSTTTITSSKPNPSAPGRTVVVKFTVTGNGSPTGSVKVTASTGEAPCTGTLSAGAGNCSLTFVTDGSRTLTATYSGDTNFNGSYTTVAQTVNGPLASLSPASVNFGNVYLGLLALQTVTLTNTGNAPMSVGKVLVSGGNDPDDFIPVSLCPSTLAAGKSCQIVVTFTADSDYYSPTGVLSVVDNAYNSPQTVALSATVINPLASLSTTSLSFSTQKVGTTSGAKAVTLTNTGTGTVPLALSTLTISGDFAFASGTTCANGATLAPTASCTISVTFKPTTTGSRSGKVVITDNALNSPQVISLSGKGD